MIRHGSAAHRIGRLLIGAGLSLTLSSCASGPAPSDHYYRFEAGTPDAPAAKKLPGNLQVDRLRADALTGERQILYQQTAGANRNQSAYRVALEFTHLSQALGLE